MPTSLTYAAAAARTPDSGSQQPQMQPQSSPNTNLRKSSGRVLKPIFGHSGGGLEWKPAAQKLDEHGRCRSSQASPGRGSGESRKEAREEHRPNTSFDEESVYVLTLKLTETLSETMDTLRERYFPKRLNRTAAHLTMFHALPHSQIQVLEQSLSQISMDMDPFPVTAGRPFRMRRGVGINVYGGNRSIKNIQEKLKSQWLAFLSEQDAGGFRPHWTVMNKIKEDDDRIEEAFRTIQAELSENPPIGQAIGLALWKYNRGYWEWASDYSFKAPPKHDPRYR